MSALRRRPAASSPRVGRVLFDRDLTFLRTGPLSRSDTELRERLSRPQVTLLVLYAGGTPAGYIELDSAAEESGTEMRYFGIILAFRGRVWLGTRSSDGLHAIANYKARGFVEYGVETEAAPPPYPSDAR